MEVALKKMSLGDTLHSNHTKRDEAVLEKVKDNIQDQIITGKIDITVKLYANIDGEEVVLSDEGTFRTWCSENDLAPEIKFEGPNRGVANRKYAVVKPMSAYDRQRRDNPEARMDGKVVPIPDKKKTLWTCLVGFPYGV